MHRFYLPPKQCEGDELFLTGREAHHALHVLHVRRGERVSVLDGTGHVLISDVDKSDRDKIRLMVVERRSVAPLPYRVTLLQAIPRGKLMEWIIEKATELGVWRIVPLLSERVVVNLKASQVARKTDKWRLSAIEAIKQCGSTWLPQIESPMLPQQFLARNERFDLALVASLQSGARHPRDYFLSWDNETGRGLQSLSVWVGPEGDFTASEMEAIKAAGVLPMTLGPLVLRSETAAIYCLSILNYELQYKFGAMLGSAAQMSF